MYLNLSYRSIIKTLILNNKKTIKKLSFQDMAKEMRVQKSYLTKVFRGEANMNSDQLFAACKYLDLLEDEREYLSLLVEYDRSVIVERKKILLEKIHKIQEKHLDTQEHISYSKSETDSLKNTEFFVDPMNQVVHMALMIPKYRKSPHLLRKDLNLSEIYFEKILNCIKKNGFINQIVSPIEVLVDFFHLSRDSIMCRPHQIAMRTISNALLFDEKNDSYVFSATICSNEEDRKKIKAHFLKFIKTVEEIVKKSKSEKIYQLNFDLFSWL